MYPADQAVRKIDFRASILLEGGPDDILAFKPESGCLEDLFEGIGNFRFCESVRGVKHPYHLAKNYISYENLFASGVGSLYESRSPLALRNIVLDQVADKDIRIESSHRLLPKRPRTASFIALMDIGFISLRCNSPLSWLT